MWKKAEKKFVGEVSNHLNRYAHVYVYLSTVNFEPPEHLRDSFDKLKIEAAAKCKAVTEAEAEDEPKGPDEPTEGGSGKKKMRKLAKGTWFEQACAIAKGRVETVMDTT